jgi:hypothetical protein
VRINHHPSIGVDPDNRDTVYAVWNDGRWEVSFAQCGTGGKHSDIAFSRSTDGGQTWTQAVRINDDALANGVDQFLPTMAVHEDGTIGVTWYDRRYDPAGNLFDLVYTQSTDGGATWSPNVRVSDQSSNPDVVPDYKGIDWLGYRRSLVFGPDYVLPSWLDTNTLQNQGDFFTDRGVFSIVTSTPTSIPTVAQPSPTNTAAPPSPTRTSTSTYTPTPTRTPTLGPNATPSSTQTGSTSTPTSTPCAIQFEDVPPGGTFYQWVRCLACRQIITGYPDGTFRPNANVTRGQLSKIVSNSAGFQENHTNQTFEDIEVGSTFYLFIERLASRGIIQGYACGGPGEPCVPPLNRPYFRPNANVTRGQTSKIVAIAKGLPTPAPGQWTFQDVSVGSTFWEWIEALAGTGAIGGYACGGPGEPCFPPENRPYFRPNANVTRGQSSKIVAETFFPNCQTP